MKRTAMAALALATAGLLAGCNSGVATGGGAGVAAKVGNHEISIDDLDTRVERGLSNAAFRTQVGAMKGDYQRQVLTRLILSRLTAVASDRLEVTVTDAQIDERIKEFEASAGGREKLLEQAAGNGVAEADLNDVVGDFVVTDALADKLVKDVKLPAAEIEAAYKASLTRYDQVCSRHILVAAENTAKSILTQLRGGADFAALAKKHSTDTSNKDKGGDLECQGRGTFVPEFEAAIFKAKKGELVGPVKTQFGFHLIRVDDRKTTTLAQATPEIREQLLRQRRDTSFREYMTKLAAELEVDVNPRFGRWDAAAQEVVAADDELSVPDGTTRTPTPGAGVPGGGTGQQSPTEGSSPAPAAS